MDDKIKEFLEAKLPAMVLQIQQLEEKVRMLEEGSIGTGIYLDGCPEYARDFINMKGDK